MFKRFFVAMMMATIMMTTTALAAQEGLESELYDMAMQRLCYDDNIDVTCTILVHRSNPKAWDCKVDCGSYYAMIYHNESNTYYGSLYTGRGSYITNLSADDAELIISQFYYTD